MHFLDGSITLLLTQQCFLNFNFELLGLVAEIHVLFFAFFVLYLLLVEIVKVLSCLLELMLGSLIVVIQK